MIIPTAYIAEHLCNYLQGMVVNLQRQRLLQESKAIPLKDLRGFGSGMHLNNPSCGINVVTAKILALLLHRIDIGVF